VFPAACALLTLMGKAGLVEGLRNMRKYAVVGILPLLPW
jgi:hypothetical protein